MEKIRSTIILLCILLLIIPGNVAFAAPQAKLFLDGQQLQSDVPPTIINGRTLVPLRVIMQALGADVVWRSNSEPILVKNEHTTVTVQVGKTRATVNDQGVTLDVAPLIIQNRLLVPLRFISESLGAGVWWDAAQRSVYITSPIGQLEAAAAIVTDGSVAGLSFQANRELELGALEVTHAGQQVTLMVNNAIAEPESQEFTHGRLAAYKVEQVGKNGTLIRLTMGEDARFLAPQAELSADKQKLTLSWPLTMKEVLFQRIGGIEELTFFLPEKVKPIITDTTIEIETTGSLPGSVIVTAGANVRSDPAVTSTRIGLIPYKGHVAVIGVTDGWYEVRLDQDTTGWIRDDLLAVETELETKVGVNVRSSPKTDNKNNILTTLYPGHKVRIIERLEGWCYVEYGGGKEGYIADYLVPLESRLLISSSKPGMTIKFPGFKKSDMVQLNIAGSSHFTAATWQEDASGTTLALQLEQTVSYRSSYTEDGWQFTFGTWVQQVAFKATGGSPRISLTLDGPGQPTAKYSAAAEAIIITIPGATLSADAVRSLNGDGIYVTTVQAEQSGSDVQIAVALPRLLAYNLKKTNTTTWELVVASPTLVGKIVAIDPGHGSTDPGALGTLGWNESDYTHDIAYRLRDLLVQGGAQVVMTRTFESGPIQGPARAVKVNQAGADLLLSIHINCATNKAARGIETWYYPRGDSARFARLVQNSLMAELGSDWPDRGIKSGNYIIVRNSFTTGVMAELGFISNARDEMLLFQPDIRQRMAQALFTAAEKYFAD